MCVCVACYCCSSWGVKMIECLNSTFVLPRPAPPRLASSRRASSYHQCAGQVGKSTRRGNTLQTKRKIGRLHCWVCLQSSSSYCIHFFFFLLLSLFLCSLLFVVHYSLCVAIGDAGSICSIFSVLPNTVVDKYCILYT